MSGTVTPIPGGGPGTAGISQALPYTLLSLPRFAQIMGIAPVHFMGATATASITPAVFPAGGSCGDIWPQHDWQKYDQVSRESLAYAIQEAERELAAVIGYWPAPMWVSEEQLMFPRDFYRTSRYQYRDVRSFYKGITVRWGRVISPGRRGITPLGTPTVSYSDLDSDGFYETASFTLATTLTDACEIKIYHAGKNGEQGWEIRPVRNKTISGGTLTVTIDSWLLIDPDLYEVFPTDDGFTAIDISTVTNFVATVDVYREYINTSEASARFEWEASSPGVCTCGTGCAACSDTTQNGCLEVRDGKAGIVTPVPASYADEAWTVASYDVCRAPDRVSAWYYAGDRDESYLRGVSCDPLSNYWARIIALLAISRLERPPCSCARLQDVFEDLRTDLSLSVTGESYFTPEEVLNNPFGTHRGEVMAWRRVHHTAPRRMTPAVI